LQPIPLPDRVFRCVLLTAVLSCIGAPVMAQNGMYPGQSIRWRPAQSPFTPGPGAIQGGPGSDPNPGSPMYICRAQDQGSLVPGKWVGGNCNVAFNNAEDVMSSYEVAYGNAQWGPYQGNLAGVIQTGHEPDAGRFTLAALVTRPTFLVRTMAISRANWFPTGVATFPLAARRLRWASLLTCCMGAEVDTHRIRTLRITPILTLILHQRRWLLAGGRIPELC